MLTEENPKSQIPNKFQSLNSKNAARSNPPVQHESSGTSRQTLSLEFRGLDLVWDLGFGICAPLPPHFGA